MKHQDGKHQDGLQSEGFVRDLRRSVAASDDELDPAREAALIDRVLAATTRREVPLFSIAGLTDALSRSGLARLVAASLVLHVGALGVVAMLAVSESKKPVAVRIDVAREPEALFAPEPAEPVFEAPVDHEVLASRERANLLRLHRFLLVRDRGLVRLAPDDSILVPDDLVKDRVRQQHESEAPVGLEDRRAAAPDPWRPRDLLRVSHDLNHWLLTGETGAESLLPFVASLDRVQRGYEEAAARIRDRARAYGLAPGEPGEIRHPLLDFLEELPRGK